MSHLHLCPLLVLVLAAVAAAGEPPFIDAKAVAERWATVTRADMDDLRQRRVLIASKSIGLNLVAGLGRLAKQDPTYALVLHKFNVEGGGGLPAIPADVFAKPGIVQFLASRYPLGKRVEELDSLLRQAPWSFGPKLDAVMVIYSATKPEVFPDYARLTDGLRRDFPRLRVLHATAMLNAAGPKEKDNASQHAFSELLRQRYRGREPVYDLGAVVSRDFRDGLFMCPDYTQDPTGVHPNEVEGGNTIAKAFILALRDALRWDGAGTAAPPQQASARPATDTLPEDHPERKAVRAILDSNGLAKAVVDGVIQVRDGHVVGLHLQEAGITELPDEIGELTRLEVLHVYGDRALAHPYLQRLSPRLARCTALRELLLNHNELTTLPAELATLTQVTTLSLADNRLRDLPPAVEAWARQRDPLGLPVQTQRR